MGRRGFEAVGALMVSGLLACQGGGAPPVAKTQAAASPLTHSQMLLLAAASIALPPEGATPATLPQPQSHGAQLVAKYCAQCHSLPVPATHSATDWPSVARRMWLRMEMLPDSLGIAVPTQSDRFVILEYLTSNALVVSSANLPAGPGREQFTVTCSQCHALPDPKVHSPQDWPQVYSRMERNMERMKVKPPTSTTEILVYLQTTAAGKRPATAPARHP